MIKDVDMQRHEGAKTSCAVTCRQRTRAPGEADLCQRQCIRQALLPVYLNMSNIDEIVGMIANAFSIFPDVQKPALIIANILCSLTAARFHVVARRFDRWGLCTDKEQYSCPANNTF